MPWKSDEFQTKYKYNIWHSQIITSNSKIKSYVIPLQYYFKDFLKILLCKTNLQSNLMLWTICVLWKYRTCSESPVANMENQPLFRFYRFCVWIILFYHKVQNWNFLFMFQQTKYHYWHSWFVRFWKSKIRMYDSESEK